MGNHGWVSLRQCLSFCSLRSSGSYNPTEALFNHDNGLKDSISREKWSKASFGIIWKVIHYCFLSMTSHSWLHFPLLFNHRWWQWETERYLGEVSCHETIHSCIKHNLYCLAGLAWKTWEDLKRENNTSNKNKNPWAMSHVHSKASLQWALQVSSKEKG